MVILSFVPLLESAVGIPLELWTKEALDTPKISGSRQRGEEIA